MNRIILFACLVLVALGGALAAARYADSRPVDVRVLFIGNSYTFQNDLPGMFAGLAEAGGRRVMVYSAVVGGWTLADHFASAETRDKIATGGWDFVVLQEQSQTPAVAAWRRAEMVPAVHSLAAAIRKSGAEPVLFVTWGRRDGWPEQGYADYAAMQAAITRAYDELAEGLAATAAPVGPAWARARREAPEIALWQEDGSHPTAAGTYLAACVIYQALLGQSPVGVEFDAELGHGVARQLQAIAAASAARQGRR